MIKIANLTKAFDAEVLLNYGDLTFEDGQSYVLLGASGCGKSTLLHMIAGILTPSSGTIDIDGTLVSELSQKRRDKFRIANIGCIFQDFKLIEEMTVEDNINILRLERVDTSSIAETLDSLGIAHLRRRKVAKLSGGEKQRTAIARALIKRPGIVLADEPTGNLNYEIGKRVVEQLLDVSREKSLIAVTHDERLASLFNHVLDMNEIVTSIPAKGGATA